MTFQASEGKGKHFLDLLDNDLNPIEPSYAKGGLWLQMFGHSNLLCACTTRAITNHAPIREYQLRFFPSLDFSCLCNNYPIELRRHILHECKRFTACVIICLCDKWLPQHLTPVVLLQVVTYFLITINLPFLTTNCYSLNEWTDFRVRVSGQE